MSKRSVLRGALVVMTLAVLASIPLDLLCAQYDWHYPDFSIVSSYGAGDGLRLPSLPMGPLRFMNHAVAVSCAMVLGISACWEHRENEDLVVAILALGACLYVAISKEPGTASDPEALLAEARCLVCAAYPLACLFGSRIVQRHMGTPSGLIFGIAAHIAAVILCAWDGLGYALSTSVPTIVWMALCWTLFAAPEHISWLKTCDVRSKVVIAVLSVLAQTFAFSTRRLLYIYWSLSLPAHTEPGYIDFNWATAHLDALMALPGSSYCELVTDPIMLGRLRRIPLAWLGIACGPIYRLAYVVLFMVFMVSVLLVLRCAPATHVGRTLRSLAYIVLLSNLWGAFCSVFSFTSTGVVTLVSSNPFQMVPIACLLGEGLLVVGKKDNVYPAKDGLDSKSLQLYDRYRRSV